MEARPSPDSACSPAQLFSLSGELLHPQVKSDAAAQLEVLRANADEQYASHMLFVFSLLLIVPAVLGLAHMLSAHRPGWGHVGAGLGLLGALVLAAFAGAELFAWQVGTAPETDATAMTALLDRVNESAGIAPLFGLAFAFRSVCSSSALASI